MFEFIGDLVVLLVVLALAGIVAGFAVIFELVLRAWRWITASSKRSTAIIASVVVFAVVFGMAAVNGTFNNIVASGFVNSVTGYQLNGAAGSANQTLCSNGTYFNTPCGVYSTIEANATAATQEPTLNLINGTNITVGCVDNSGSHRTDCTINGAASPTSIDEYWNQAACDVTAGSANNCSFTITLPVAMPDTSYYLICQLAFDLNPNPTAFLMYAGSKTTNSQLAYVTEVMGNSQSGSFSTNVDCHAHHN